MKPSEFIEKYWGVQQPDGTQKPLVLSEYEKKALDVAAELGVQAFTLYIGRYGKKVVINPIVVEYLNSQQNT